MQQDNPSVDQPLALAQGATDQPRVTASRARQVDFRVHMRVCVRRCFRDALIMPADCYEHMAVA